MSTSTKPLFFFQFLGTHSLLIGLLPFFLPVYLWTHGLSLEGLCLLIGASGLAFCSALTAWQQAAKRWPLRRLIALTFLLEVVLVFIVGILTTVPGAALFQPPPEPEAGQSTTILVAALVIGTANGLYNAFFWTTQRILFLRQLGHNDSGRQYGNLQIFVTLILKVGILLGGVVLDNGGFVWLLGLSAGISLVASNWLARACSPDRCLRPESIQISLMQSLRFKDNRGSRTVFAIDGIFLYLESHFWTLSLFLLVREDFSRLGVAVVLLALTFAIAFYLIKNHIDKLPVAIVFKVSVWLYACSWLGRVMIGDSAPDTGVLVLLILIAFFSSFFRLAFNKLFFDIARRSESEPYLLFKSYASQWVLGLFYLAVGTLLHMLPISTEASLSMVYVAAAVVSLGYLRYISDRVPE